MIGLIPRPMHAVLDYLWGIAHYFAPQLFEFEDNEAATLFSNFRGASMVVASMTTRYELGLIRLIPFNMHLLLDLMGALFSLGAPWLLGFDKNEKARNAVLGFAFFEIGAVLLSKRDKK